MLTSQLGNPERKILTVAQLRRLASRARAMEKPEGDADLQEADLMAIGYGEKEARRIVSLLSEEDVLCWYLSRGAQKDCFPITRVSFDYPDRLRLTLGDDCPGCLWAKGDRTILEKPAIALVGSRDLLPDNHAFAAEVGRQAARQGYVLVSGNARGADRTAQDACLENGGQVISVVADKLEEHPMQDNVLYLSENGYDSAFSAQRALSRNRVIHCLTNRTFVAQCTLGKGGTWDGVTKNLHRGWSGVFCFADKTPAMEELTQMGAQSVEIAKLQNFDQFEENTVNFF